MEQFAELAGSDAKVWIHGSRDDGRDPATVIETIEWVATWKGWEHGLTSGPSSTEFRRARPPTAAHETNWWFAYYLVDGLTELDMPIPTREFSSWSTDSAFSGSFIPRGPTIATGPSA